MKIVANFNYPDNGYKSDQEEAEKRLLKGNEYVVRTVDVQNSRTELGLELMTGVYEFNSVLFDVYLVLPNRTKIQVDPVDDLGGLPMIEWNSSAARPA